MSHLTASQRLDAALLGMVERGERPPCHESPGHLSDDAHERAQATQICATCPVADLCGAAAIEHRERFGVWGDGIGRPGRDRTPRQTTTTRRTA